MHIKEYPIYVFQTSEIMISPVEDSTGITAYNWYEDEYKRAVVLGEVKKIGIYMQKNEHLENGAWIQYEKNLER